MNLKNGTRVWRHVDGSGLVQKALSEAEGHGHVETLEAKLEILSGLLARVLDRFPDDVALDIALPYNIDWEIDARSDNEIDHA